MESGRYVILLGEFVTGEIELPEFRQFVEERLFELRQKPKMTEEKKLLSSIELYLHEAEEGQRSGFEVYAHVQFILDDILLAILKSNGESAYFSPAAPKLHYSLSRKFDIDRDRELSPITKDLPLVASK